MRFHQLAVGARFEYEGEVWVKTSPVIASRQPDGGQRLIARSASVTPLAEPTSPAPVAQDPALARDAVLAAFEAYHTRCRELLQAAGTDDAAVSELEEQRRAFLAALAGRGNPGPPRTT